MITKISMDTHGVMARLMKMLNKTGNLRPALKLAGVHMYKSINENFQAQGRPTGWRPLKEKTIKRRRKGKGVGTAQILLDTGVLRASVTSPTPKKAKAKSIYRLSNDRLEIGTNLTYAMVHQKGSTKKNIPARPYMLFQTEDSKKIQKIFKNYVVS